MDTEQKLNILAESGRFDLACACKGKNEPGRTRGPEGRWIYPASLPSGRKVFLLKTLLSNACINDCSYCPFNSSANATRCTLDSEALAEIFMQLLVTKRVSGLFLSSGVFSSPDTTMAKMLATVEILRKRRRFKGFIHLKIIPGACDAAIEQAVRLATRVSVNIEAPNADRLARLSKRKRFHEDIIAAMRSINTARQKINRPCSQTTQFVVGAAGESDREIVTATSRLYKGYEMERVYFSAYQDFTDNRVTGQQMLFNDMPSQANPADQAGFIREHRLYQVDFLLRKYQFSQEDITFEGNGNLSLQRDPKQIWADLHPEFFPVNVNLASKYQLLRVPGIGPVGANRIVKARYKGRISCQGDLLAMRVRAHQARQYLIFN